MGHRQSLILCLVFSLFLIFGALIFRYLEREEYVEEPQEWRRLKDIALMDYGSLSPYEVRWLVAWISANCSDIDNSTINILISEGSHPDAVEEMEYLCPDLHRVRYEYTMPFVESLFMCMTILSTIGYGSQYPVTAAGRVMCIIYAVTGIPLTGVMLIWTSDFFGEQFFKLFKAKLDAKQQQTDKFIALFTLIYVAIGFVVFILIPAGIFAAVDYWSYLDSVYFAVISQTTVGFGDLVTGYEIEGGWARVVYQIFVIVWIMTGLGYWVTVVTFLTKALKSRRQSSFLRSAEEMKASMLQMGIKDTDPRFLSFVQQLNNLLGVEKGASHDATAFLGTSSPSAAPLMN